MNGGGSCFGIGGKNAPKKAPKKATKNAPKKATKNAPKKATKATKNESTKSKKKMAENEFYSVKDRKKIMVDKKSIKAEYSEKNGNISYMLRADVDGKKLVKFVSKEVYDKYKSK